ncbi:N-chimaerin [Schistocerca americana]|uniref:N-chimaerin n=1 Tax=Schistocerca americana TaxID=7009 RepID=UPI001F4F2BF2|nr:N-chimaerin [Schistocerca americana]XP_049946012.1 N-chimaerin isoform X1 [Schistocerca serialis cubense]
MSYNRLSNGDVNQEGSPIRHVWNPNLYRLQQEAPRPIMVPCSIPVHSRPQYYGREYHGDMSHTEAEAIVTEEGAFLVRRSNRNGGCFTLTFRFGGKLKHYKLYYDGQHYVLDKRFDTVHDLVADGLVTLYIETHARSYIELMDSISCYETSPYVTLNKLKRRAVIGCNVSLLQAEREASQISGSDVADSSVDIDFSKPHNFKIHTFKGLNWCEFCGNFLWGFTAQGVKCEDCGFSAHCKCSRKVPSDCLPKLKGVRGVFGLDLTTLASQQRSHVPRVVRRCVEEIERRGLDTEGLYRVSGFAEEVEALKLALDTDGELADLGPEKYDNINVIAGALKLYLRLLPIPLITFDAHPPLIEATKKKTVSEQLAAMKEAVMILPPAHYQTLKFLMEHLYRVSQHVDTNKMTSHNLSTVFAPTLMPSPDPAKISGAMYGMALEIAALEMLITHCETVFR